MEWNQRELASSSKRTRKRHHSCSRSLVVAAARHLEPVELLLDLVEGIVADLVAGAHGEHGLPCGVKRSLVNVAVGGARTRSGPAVRVPVAEMCRELVTDGVGD